MLCRTLEKFDERQFFLENSREANELLRHVKNLFTVLEQVIC